MALEIHENLTRQYVQKGMHAVFVSTNYHRVVSNAWWYGPPSQQAGQQDEAVRITQSSIRD